MAGSMILCQWCQTPTRPVRVHGHTQCEHCRINIEPCCSGESCDTGGPEPDLDDEHPQTLAQPTDTA